MSRAEESRPTLSGSQPYASLSLRSRQHMHRLPQKWQAGPMKTKTRARRAARKAEDMRRAKQGQTKVRAAVKPPATTAGGTAIGFPIAVSCVLESARLSLPLQLPLKLLGLVSHLLFLFSLQPPSLERRRSRVLWLCRPSLLCGSPLSLPSRLSSS